MTPTTSRHGSGWARGALGFAAGYGLLRLYWATGGRWGYTACDRTRSPGAAERSTGCGAEQLAALPLWRGWGAAALCCVLAAVAALVVLGRGRAARLAARPADRPAGDASPAAGVHAVPVRSVQSSR